MTYIDIRAMILEEPGSVSYEDASLDEALDLLAEPMSECWCNVSVRGFAHEDAYMTGFDLPFFGPYQLDAELVAKGLRIEDDLPF